MNQWTRRDLLRATVASAAAVPAIGLGGSRAIAAVNSSGDRPEDEAEAIDAAELAAAGPMMVFVSDAERGDVSILHGTSEVVVHDHKLVAKIVRAGHGARKG